MAAANISGRLKHKPQRKIPITRSVGSVLKKRRVALSARGPESPVADGQLLRIPTGPHLSEMTPTIVAEVANTSGILIVPHGIILLAVPLPHRVNLLFTSIKSAK